MQLIDDTKDLIHFGFFWTAENEESRGKKAKRQWEEQRPQINISK